MCITLQDKNKYGTYLFIPDNENICGYKYEGRGNLPNKLCLLKDKKLDSELKEGLLSIGLYSNDLQDFSYFNTREIDNRGCVKVTPRHKVGGKNIINNLCII